MFASIVAAAVGFVLGVAAAGRQHQLYRQPEFRAQPASGRKLLVMRVALGLALALAFALAWRPDHHEAGAALATSLFLAALLVLASTDFERRLLPNRLMYPAIAAAVLLCWAWPERSVADVALGGAIAAALGFGLYVLGGLVGAILGVRATPFGLGDVKLILLMGLLCGWPGFLTALFIGVLLAGVPSLAIMLSGRRRRIISYGPFLAAGCCVVLLWPAQFAA